MCVGLTWEDIGVSFIMLFFAFPKFKFILFLAMESLIKVEVFRLTASFIEFLAGVVSIWNLLLLFVLLFLILGVSFLF